MNAPKMFFHKSCKIFIFLLIATKSFAQNDSWTKDEQQFYNAIKSLCEHFKGKTYDTLQREYVFEHFVYFDNILADTSKTRVRERIKIFDAFFFQLTHFVDSVGLDNLDAKPTYIFKKNKAFFEPYNEGGNLNELLPLTLAYYDKRRPKKPLGTLLFEPNTHKLLAWIIINQGGYRYFLTFNLF